MTTQVSDPPDSAQPPGPGASQLLQGQPARFSKNVGAGLAPPLSLLVVIGALLFLLSGLVIDSLPQLHTAQHGRQVPTATQGQDETASPISVPSNRTIPPLQLPGERFIIYEQQGNLYLVPGTGDGAPQLLATQGYAYSQSVRPILTATGQLLYSGNGLWLTDVFDGTSTEVATLAPNQIITSMTLSSDGTTLAWTTEPIDGNGETNIYAGPLNDPKLVYQQPDAGCPCFRVFSFMNGPGEQGDRTLLLTDDQDSHEGVQYGLWTLDLSSGTASAQPQPLLDEDSLQGPLVLAPYQNILLYSNDEGVVPYPTDSSVPPELGPLTYANSLSLSMLSSAPMFLSVPQVILPQQRGLNNAAAFHWVTTPMFTPDAHTLVYVEFSSDTQPPYDRHSALYTVQIASSGTGLRVSRPRLLATSTARLVELGAWLNDHIITFYADGTLYALDISSGAFTPMLQTQAYARIVAVLGSPPM